MLYVGKAKRLRSRVRSYFATDHLESVKTRALMRQAADLDTIVVPTEAHALILEANLIKEYRPRFNIALRDDKSYPYIKVTIQEPFPRVFVTRRLHRRRRAVLRPVHRRRRDAARAQRREAHLHRAVVQLRHAARDAGARLPRLSHRPVQGAVHSRAVAGRLPRDDRRGAAVPRWSDGRGRCGASASAWTTRRRIWTSSARPSCAMRCGTSSGWRSRRSSLEVEGGDRDVIGYARDGDDACVAILRIRGGKLLARDHRFLENIDGEDDAAVLVGLSGSHVRDVRRARGRAARAVRLRGS